MINRPTNLFIYHMTKVCFLHTWTFLFILVKSIKTKPRTSIFFTFVVYIILLVVANLFYEAIQFYNYLYTFYVDLRQVAPVFQLEWTWKHQRILSSFKIWHVKTDSKIYSHITSSGDQVIEYKHKQRSK